MKLNKILLFIVFLFANTAHSEIITIEGSHTFTQPSDMDLYRAIDNCLSQALINGVYNYLSSDNNYNEEQKIKIMSVLEKAINMIVIDPLITSQEINNNIITIRAKANISTTILYHILNN